MKEEFKILSNNIVIRISSKKLNETDVDNKTIEIVNILKKIEMILTLFIHQALMKFLKEKFFLFFLRIMKKRAN